MPDGLHLLDLLLDYAISQRGGSLAREKVCRQELGGPPTFVLVFDIASLLLLVLGPKLLQYLAEP